MSKKHRTTCNDCYFRRAGLCALPGEEVCPTFRLNRTGSLEPPRQPPLVPRSRPEGGYFLWLDLPDGVDTAALLERATEAGVTFVAGRDFFPQGAGGESSLRLAYSLVSPAEISDGIARLAACAASVPV